MTSQRGITWDEWLTEPCIQRWDEMCDHVGSDRQANASRMKWYSSPLIIIQRGIARFAQRRSISIVPSRMKIPSLLSRFEYRFIKERSDVKQVSYSRSANLKSNELLWTSIIAIPRATPVRLISLGTPEFGPPEYEPWLQHSEVWTSQHITGDNWPSYAKFDQCLTRGVISEGIAFA